MLQRPELDGGGGGGEKDWESQGRVGVVLQLCAYASPFGAHTHLPSLDPVGAPRLEQEQVPGLQMPMLPLSNRIIILATDFFRGG